MADKNSDNSNGCDRKPEPPLEPETWECCQNGCDPCVYDRYWQALEIYEQAMQAWQARHRIPKIDSN
jgi:hypothetical protein